MILEHQRHCPGEQDGPYGLMGSGQDHIGCGARLGQSATARPAS